MIPGDWEPHHRASDGELVGYLVTQADSLAPVNLVGTALAGPMDRARAIAILEELGLASLNERRWCRLPTPLSGGIDVHSPRDDWTWRAVLIVESNPGSCVIRPENPWPEEVSARVQVPVPVGELLRVDQPID